MGNGLAKRVYDLSSVNLAVLGGGVDTNLTYDACRFREKYGMEKPFILYAGRKDTGKNVDTLLQYFVEYKKRRITDLQLVLIGGGSIDVPKDIKLDVHDLGFVDAQDKYDAYVASRLLCQPSHNESFSLVIMESWLCCRPVLVNADCAVTKNFAVESNGGLYFADYFEFEGAVDYILGHSDEVQIMGECGYKYVK